MVLGLRLGQRPGVIEPAFVLGEFPLLKEIPDVRLGFIPVGECDLNDNILTDILIGKVRVVEKQGRTGRKPRIARSAA